MLDFGPFLVFVSGDSKVDVSDMKRRECTGNDGEYCAKNCKNSGDFHILRRLYKLPVSLVGLFVCLESPNVEESTVNEKVDVSDEVPHKPPVIVITDAIVDPDAMMVK